MNFLARSLAYLAVKAAAISSKPFSAMNHDMVRMVFGAPTAAGVTVDDESMMRVGAAWACRRILSETIGSIPWAIYKRTGDRNAERDDDHPLSAVLINSPNAEQTDVEFREALSMGLTGRGNSYTHIDRTGKRIASLMPISPKKVQTLRKGPGVHSSESSIADGDIFHRIDDRGRYVDLPQEKVWHVKGFGEGTLVGLSPIGAAKEALGGALAMERFANSFFAQGGKPAGIVTIPNFLKPDQRPIARENLQQMMGGLGNAHKFALFEGGMKPEPWGDMPFDEMEFIAGRKFSIQEVCRFYRIPPHMVADLDKATFSNIEHLSQEFVMFTLMPYFTRIEASAKKWLFSPEDRSKYFLRFNYEGLLRADSAGRAAFYASALQNGWLNRNEVRGLENRNRSDAEGMDDYTIQSNMAFVDQLTDMVAAKLTQQQRGLGAPPQQAQPPSA
jgi:HK97 family phage portal protein